MAKVHSGEEILPRVSTPRVGRTNVTDDKQICDSNKPNVQSYRLRSGKIVISDIWLISS